VRAIDVAEASGTLLLDVAHRRWSQEMLDATHLDASCLPELFESQQVVGKITAHAANETGLKAGTPVVAGAGDQGAGAVGIVLEGIQAVLEKREVAAYHRKVAPELVARESTRKLI